MKRSVFIALCIFLSVPAFTQNDDERNSVLHVSFVPPMSTHGTQAVSYTNLISFNILAGISENERAFTFGGLANIAGNDMSGLQFAGLHNYAGHDGRGMMFRGLGNLVGNDYKGFQFAGLVNIVCENVNGLQFAGLYNYAGHAGRGMMFGGLGNTAGSGFKGFQFGGLANTAGRMTGFQLGGLMNITDGMDGFQFAGLINLTKQIKGAQFGGLGNVAGDVSGFQFGTLFNVAKNVRGVQFAGLVNVAESSDYPLAILNIIRKGEYGVGFTLDEKGSMLMELRSGGRVTYGILGVGYNYKTDGDVLTTECGLGAHLRIVDRFRINFEIKGGTIGNFSDDEPTFYTNFGIFPAVRLFSSHFELFAGPTLNYMRSDDQQARGLFPKNSIFLKNTASRREQIFAGGQAGMHYIF